MKGQLLLLMEDSFSVAIWFGSQEILFSEIMTYEEAMETIEAIATADLQRVGQELFSEGKLNLAVVGPWSFGPSPWSCGPRTQGTKDPFKSEEGFRELLEL